MDCRNLFFVACFSLFCTNAPAQEPQRHQIVDDMDVYLGVIPAQVTLEYPPMHGGPKLEEHRYHVMVALFDKNSGERITTAEVRATVSPLGQAGVMMELEPMYEQAPTFGNYFTFPEPEHYRIKVDIQRGNQGEVATANFVYWRPLD